MPTYTYIYICICMCIYIYITRFSHVYLCIYIYTYSCAWLLLICLHISFDRNNRFYVLMHFPTSLVLKEIRPNTWRLIDFNAFFISVAVSVAWHARSLAYYRRANITARHLLQAAAVAFHRWSEQTVHWVDSGRRCLCNMLPRLCPPCRLQRAPW